MFENNLETFSQNYSLTDYMVIASDSESSFNKFCDMLNESYNQYHIDENNFTLYLGYSTRPYIYTALSRPRPLFPYDYNKSDICSLMEVGVMKDLPYELNQKNIKSFIRGWLQQTKYPNQPDTDGSCKKGYFMCVYHNVLIVKPYWMIYGK